MHVFTSSCLICRLMSDGASKESSKRKHSKSLCCWYNPLYLLMLLKSHKIWKCMITMVTFKRIAKVQAQQKSLLLIHHCTISKQDVPQNTRPGSKSNIIKNSLLLGIHNFIWCNIISYLALALIAQTLEHLEALQPPMSSKSDSKSI